MLVFILHKLISKIWLYIQITPVKRKIMYINIDFDMQSVI